MRASAYRFFCKSNLPFFVDKISQRVNYFKTSVAKAMKVLRKLGCCLQIEVILFGQVPEIVE